jgi:uroporphyrinogen-III synthase
MGAAAPAGNLTVDLQARGFSAQHVAVYESTAIPSDELRPALAALPWIDGIIVHSPKAARHLAVFLAECGNLWRGTAFCISNAAAAPIQSVTAFPVLVADSPTEEALIDLVTSEDEAATPSHGTGRVP